MKETEALAVAVQRAKFDPDWFCENILRMPNELWQSEFLNAVADLDRIQAGIPTLFNHEGLNQFSLVTGHGPGKTHLLAKAIHWFNFTRKARVPCIGPREKSVKDRLWPEFRKIRNSALDSYKNLLEVRTTRIIWGKDVDWTAIIESAATPENLAGYHDDCILFLVDESSGVNEQMWPVAYGVLSTSGSVLISAGNPTKTTGEFYKIHNHPLTMSQVYKRYVHPSESKYVSPAWVDSMVAKYGRNSPVVKVRVFGEFSELSDNQLISLEWLQEALLREHEPDGSIPRKRITCDVADGGEDETIIMVAVIYETFTWIERIERFSFEPSVAVIDAGEACIRMWEAEECSAANGDDLVIDCIGVGTGVAGHVIKHNGKLREEDKHKMIPVYRYKGGATSDDPKQWRNRRTQSHLVMRDALRDKKVGLHDRVKVVWDDFTAQVCSVKTRLGIERVEDLDTKESMKKAGLKSPDMSDAFSMVYCGKRPSVNSEDIPLIIGHSTVGFGPGVM